MFWMQLNDFGYAGLVYCDLSKKKKKRIGFLWLASEVEFNLERQY